LREISINPYAFL